MTSTKPGRRSVRLESRQTFDQGILITDFAHIPIGVCGSWPAYWTYNYGEEPYGEVDIIEGANNQTGDELSLHTSARCRLEPDPRYQTGSDVRSDCSLATNYIDGCGVSGPPESYGDPFNALGGGVWALVIDNNDLAVWMFARAGIPDDILSGKQPTPSNWGKPLLHFKSHPGCRVFEQWKNQTIVSHSMLHSTLPREREKSDAYPINKKKQIFNIDFCGENAGGSNWYDSTSAFSNQSCASSTGFPSCEAFVAANPQAFSNSYFLINSIKLYRLTTPTFSATVSHQGNADVRKSHNGANLILLAIAILFLLG